MINVDGNKNGSPTHQYIEWMYPEIYDTQNPSTITIGLSHVRAADDIRIKYDGNRDGWVVEQASIFEWDISNKECDPDWKEVAFIKAWGREQEQQKEQT
jgi:hypothetical protein